MKDRIYGTCDCRPGYTKTFGKFIATLIYDGWLKVWEFAEPNGHKKQFVSKPDSVAFLVYNRTRRELIFVRQQRVASADRLNPSGLVLEAPAGHIEENEFGYLFSAMRREAEEELGIRFTEDGSYFDSVNCHCPLLLSPGVLTEKMWLGYLEIDDSMIEQQERCFGLQEEGEEIERVWIPLQDLPGMTFTDMKTFALVQWFLLEKYPQLVDQKGTTQ